MTTPKLVLIAGLAFAAASCSEDRATPITPAMNLQASARKPAALMKGYVAVGTSISMGWMSDGVVAESQKNAWTRQLAEHFNVAFKVPAIDGPGCQPPLAAPLVAFKRVDGTGPGRSTVCAPNVPGTTLPTSNLAIENATAAEALNATPATASQGRQAVTSRVLPAGMTQITMMRALNPSFVSVEFGGNEILPAQVGLLYPGVTFTPFNTFAANYSSIIDSVKATGASAVLVSIRADLRNFPTIRTAAEIASQRAVFAQYHVTVNADCDTSQNLIFVRGKVLTAIATGAGRAGAGLPPYDFSCADVPGTPDYVLTPADIAFLNTLSDQMSAEIERHAAVNGYAVFNLGSLYNRSKQGVPFDLTAFLTSALPYGELISLDGVHPSAKGHAVLARNARKAIQDTYGKGRDR